MDGLISRQAAIDVGRDLIIPVDGYYMYNQAINNYCAELINLPAAQPEIIRCKECKHRPDEAWFGCPMASSSKWQLDGFCSYAERRTDDR